MVSGWNWWMILSKLSRTLSDAKPQMMASERSESIWDNFGKFIYQFQPETKTLIRKLERILTNYIDKMCLLFNQTCLNLSLSLSLSIYIYIYIHSKAIIRWWAYSQVWFQGWSIIATKPECLNNNLWYYQALLVWCQSAGIPNPCWCSFCLISKSLDKFSFFLFVTSQV